MLAMNLTPNKNYLLLDNVIFELHMMVWMVDSYKQIDFMDKFSLCKICLNQSNTIEIHQMYGYVMEWDVVEH